MNGRKVSRWVYGLVAVPPLHYVLAGILIIDGANTSQQT